MRTFTRLFSLLAALLPVLVFANVYVHGTVRVNNGNIGRNALVHIVADSNISTSNCYQVHTKMTDSLGRYSDTLICSSNMQIVTVWIQSCGGIVRLTDTLSPNRQYAEINLILCASNMSQCYSSFSSQSSFLTTSFYSGSSLGSTTSDSIISRTWTFGDSTSLSGNIVNPVHTYAQAGSYNVCLKIKTFFGCESTSCQTVQVATNTSCSASFGYSRPNIPNTALFSSTSSAGIGDSIISRKWKFGDGDSLTGNTIYPQHTYPAFGNYTACLTIKTRQGCEKTTCSIVTLPNPATSCKAFLIHYPANGSSVQFVSYYNVVPGDSVISYHWIFGDGTSGLDSLHTYSVSGTFNACFVIQTRSGCGDTACTSITVTQPHCEAVFSVDTVATPTGGSTAFRYFKFNSTNSHGISATDNVVSRKWKFGDGDSLISNVVIPVHGYANSGVYNVCLYITTASGCRDTLCEIVTIAAPIVCHAAFVTTSYPADSSGYKIKFNASTSTPSSGSTITQYSWSYGDGTSGTGIDPTHIYAQMGIYNVCLRIISSTGCRDSICNTVIVQGNCLARLSIDSMGLGYGPNVSQHFIRFSSMYSHASQGTDTIISRKWQFGDGDSLVTTSVIVNHVYTGSGNFNACLTIKTSRGCENSYCSNVYFPNPLTFCRANFLYNLTSITNNSWTINFSSRTTIVAPGDSIVNCHWIYGDGTSGSDSTHQYTQAGTYTACLQITCASGCRDTICKSVIVSTPHCQASFWSETTPTPAGANPALFYKQFVNQSTTAISDSVISCKWNFGDGTSQITTGSTIHGYTVPGNYTICLYITTATGCRDTSCGQILVRDSTTPPTCQPRFTASANALLVTFNGSSSTIAPGDSIINRTWSFGDGSTSTSSAVVLTHQYPRPGVYSACLTIRTRLGCIATVCKQFAVADVSGNCVPFFTKEQVAAPAKTMRLNSSAAYSQLTNDSIIARKWEFGDGQVLTGNVINPLHTYSHGGTFTVCLTIYTTQCDKKWCQTIQVLPIDSTNTTDSVSIVNLYPVPVISPLNVVLHSSHANVNAQLSIYDVYGVLKWTQNTVLPFGNSTYSIPTSSLTGGSYIFKLTTVYGVKSRSFYKIN